MSGPRPASVADLVDAGLDAQAVAFLAEATPEQRGEVLAALHAAADHRRDELRAAVDGALKIVPAPLRGRIKKLLR